MRVEIIPRGLITLKVGDKTYTVENAISNYTQITMLNLLSQRGCTNTYPCLQVKAVALYDQNNSLIKVLTAPSYSDGTAGGYYYVYSKFADSGTDTYTVYALKLFALPTGWPDQQSNYYEIAKTTLSSGVQKPSTQSLTVAWGLGVKLSTSNTDTGFLTAFTTQFYNAIVNGSGALSGTYNLDIYDPNNNIIKTLSPGSVSTGGGGGQPYTVTISFTDTSSTSYSIQRAVLYGLTASSRYDYMNVYLTTPVSKGTSPATVNLTISLPYAYLVSSSGVPSTYS
jgi:hypothetical protein